MASISTLPIPNRFPDPFTTEPHVPERVIGERRNYRTVWVSDIHLGTRGCNAGLLIDFFDHVDCETLYLVGDIIDGWRLKKRHFWPVEIRREAVHETADGRKLLIVYGDEFDAVMLAHRWLAFVGDAAYTALMKCNVVVNAIRSRLGLPYWSLSMVAKHKVKNAVQFIGHYEEVVAHAARSRGVDGVVCGHIHSAEMRAIDGVDYYNDGDWVEGCTALVEHHDGRMEILHWAEEVAARDAPAPLGLPAAAKAA